jgi:hypothetical protein
MKIQEIAPKWSCRIKKDYLTTYDIEKLRKPDSCIVGEAHGFTDEYMGGGKHPCRECWALGQLIYSTIDSDFKRKDDKDYGPFLPGQKVSINCEFDYSIEQFEAHWTASHSF